MRTTVLGHVCIDHNQSENATYTAAGSPAVFIDRIYRLYKACKTTIIAPYGRDFIPFAQDLTLLPTELNEEKTLVYENISTSNKRSQKALNRKTAFYIPLSEEIKKALSFSEVVIVAPLLPNLTADYLKTMLSFTPAKSLKVLLPQGYFRDFDNQNRVIPRGFKEWSEIIPQFDIITVSMDDKPNIEQDIVEWLNHHPQLLVVMTMADQGAKIFTADYSQLISTIPVPEDEVVDSVGSGDIFTAVFIYHYQKHKDPVRAVKYANDVAARCLKYTVDELYLAFQENKF